MSDYSDRHVRPARVHAETFEYYPSGIRARVGGVMLWLSRPLSAQLTVAFETPPAVTGVCAALSPGSAALKTLLDVVLAHVGYRWPRDSTAVSSAANFESFMHMCSPDRALLSTTTGGLQPYHTAAAVPAQICIFEIPGGMR